MNFKNVVSRAVSLSDATVFCAIFFFSFFCITVKLNAQCTTPSDQDFGTYEDLTYGPSLTYGCITYTGSNPVGVEVGIGNAADLGFSPSPAFSESAVVMFSDGDGGGYAEFYTENGYDFGIKSFTAEFVGHSQNLSESYNIVGYRDNVEVVRADNLNVISSATAGSGNAAVSWNRINFSGDWGISGTLSFGTDWGNIDKVRIYVVDGAPNDYFFISLDNLDFEPAVTLPVTFGGINAQIKGHQLNVNWQTLSETNNDHFEVQVSKDGKTFTTISTVKSKVTKGTSLSAYDYTVSIDIPGAAEVLGISALSLLFLALPDRRRKVTVWVIAVALGWVFYSCGKHNGDEINIDSGKIYLRIAQVDKDGTKTYSKTIVVNNED